MTRRDAGFLLLFVPAIFLCVPAHADEDAVHRKHYGYRHHGYRHHGYWILPPERHVIEIGAFRGYFIINGTSFTPKAPWCLRWVAGDRVKFLAGSIHGACESAWIFNATRRETCEFWCR